METKKYFWSLVFLPLILSLSVSCQQLVRRGEQRPKVTETKEVPGKETPPQPRPIEVTEKPEFLKKEAPPLGIILGAGGALSYAHIGFLHEIENQKIPVHAIAGMEWGAMVAGSYSMTRKAHATEWKLLKLPVQQFESNGFFTSGKQPVNVNKFSGFLNEVFGRTKFLATEIPFACSFTSLPKETNTVYKTGYLKNGIKICWPYPPHFKVETVAANPMGLKALASFLRKQGAERIVYVDVLSDNKLTPSKLHSSDPVSALIWTQNRQIGDLVKSGIVDDVISISLSGYSINSYKELRALVRLGQLKSKTQLKGLAKKYAY